MKKITCIFMACITVIMYMPLTASAKEYTAEEIYSIALDIIKWKKADNGAGENESLINGKYLELAGTTPGDWYQIGMSRLGIEDDYAAYLAVIEQQIEKRYATKKKLSSSKATEWHRISLSVLASGGDPLNMGTDSDGNPINLIADGTYDRGKTASLGKQGINGWIWGLIALDSMKYEIPDGAYYSRDDIIDEILKRQLPDGGFALSGNVSDPDMTAMAVQALAPYYSRQEVKDVVDEAITLLSELQLETGDFCSWGMENVESTAQVAIALCCLDIDPLTDSRFIKNGNTLLDGILRYRMSDGGFVHSFTYDPENPSSKPNESNSMAGEQTLLALAAMWRIKNGKSSIYDFTDTVKNETVEFSEEDKKLVDGLPEKLSTEYYVTVITLLDKLESSGEFLEKQEYRQKLLDAKRKIETIQAEIDRINSEIRNEISPLTSSPSSDGNANGRTLIDDSADKNDGTDTSSAAVVGKDVSLDTEAKIDSIISDYEGLSDYDKEKIEDYEDVLKAKTEFATRRRTVAVAVVSVAVLCGLVAVLGISVYNRIKRRKKKAAELAEMYGEDK